MNRDTCPDCGKPLYPDAIHTCTALAIRLADILGCSALQCDVDAAAELRRLHEANEAFGQRQQWWNERMFKLEAENEALREALEEITSVAEQVDGWQSFPQEPIDIARAALARAGEVK